MLLVDSHDDDVAFVGGRKKQMNCRGTNERFVTFNLRGSGACLIFILVRMCPVHRLPIHSQRSEVRSTVLHVLRFNTNPDVSSTLRLWLCGVMVKLYEKMITYYHLVE